ncbi:DUF1127 domain-containing protein [Aliiroseovarius subalbicans]|uniref:DUF1127 domain-containing protein n=1 Tax=Aliiroseovarius subalbicans TaxID=2925840 RepID=UPI001F5A7261|nr:DUF1127 domain-containing protein [Aliiroseovarius subalbicans]MCI2397981.1 DUF1127 domain-containing protein [Aliiroseovarius subalbicans]
MAYATQTNSFDAGIADRMVDVFRTWIEAREQRRMYRQTVRELRALSGRELADLGIAPGEIAHLAHMATFGK